MRTPYFNKADFIGLVAATAACVVVALIWMGEGTPDTPAWCLMALGVVSALRAGLELNKPQPPRARWF